jgi:hypothetical protein
MMPPGWRKAALATHVIGSVGWIGAVAGFLALALAGTTMYPALELMGRWVLVPLSLASLVSGLVLSLGTRWGLMRHYWVLSKLFINLLATAILLEYTQTLRLMVLSPAAVPVMSPILHASAALILLTIAVILAVYKPRGLTRYGWRRTHAAKGGGTSKGAPGWSQP